MQTEKVAIKHSFTDVERLSLGEEQSELLGKQDELEATLKSAKTQIQAQIDACDASIRSVSSKLRSRYEMRNVECILMDNRVPGFRYVVRLDNGHVATSRKLRADEMQMKLEEGTPRMFVAIALLPVDADTVDAEAVEVKVFEDEFEALRALPDVKMRDIPASLGEGKKKGK
jgi:hypothetical protein